MYHFALLAPKGIVAAKELTLMTNVIALMLITAVPVLFLTFFFAWWYRASNTRALYTPDWEHGVMSELVWWAIPIEIILVLGAVTWSSTHALDPHKALPSHNPPLTIQVVALDYKWLFIYPEQGIASVNYVQFPANRPVTFQITADAPMNSFWIPELGGQIYAMTGMSNVLNLMADNPGKFVGRSANYSGIGFAHMNFVAEATTENDFNRWLDSVRASPLILSSATYAELRKPGTVNAPVRYASVTDHLYRTIIETFTGAMHMH